MLNVSPFAFQRLCRDGMQGTWHVVAGLLIAGVVILLYVSRSTYVSTTMRVTLYNSSDVNGHIKNLKYQEEKPDDSRLNRGQGEITQGLVSKKKKPQNVPNHGAETVQLLRLLVNLN